MNPATHRDASTHAPRPPLRIGFMPLTDCAPIVMAHELGLYGKFGLHVQLRREREWTALRDKLVNGELDAIQALATMPFALQLGLHCEPCACVTGMVLSLQGNAIILSEDLHRRGVVGGPSLRREVFRTFGRKTLTFGVPSATSTHTLLLRHWHKSAQINPDHHVRIIALSPLEMYPNRKALNQNVRFRQLRRDISTYLLNSRQERHATVTRKLTLPDIEPEDLNSPRNQLGRSRPLRTSERKLATVEITP